MGQVPENSCPAGWPGTALFAAAPSYGIAGDGRVARHFAHYLDLLGLRVARWSRRQEAIDGIAAEEKLGGCDVLLVLLSDSAIEPFLRARPGLSRCKAIHFSGALVTPLAQGFHPLMTFGPELHDRATYERIVFVCERGELRFPELFPALANPHHELAPELKGRYHALCVLGGNFTVLLWQKLFEDFETRLSLPADAAKPYLRKILENLERNPRQALTGPLARGDAGTVAANLASLEGDAFQEVYQAFVRACAPALSPVCPHERQERSHDRHS
ncbi:MAG: DUF2520 domain-containing protein [Oligoflexia bacterium]|nr:DUF2520 domain-containing protein [Oligoflexia bacterium]